MSDEFDPLEARLKAALKAAPSPEAEARARALALAMENFDRLQASGAEARPKEDRPRRAGFFQGARSMMNFLTSRPALAATTSVAALIVGVTVLLPVAENLTPTAMPKLAAPEAPHVPASSVADAGAPAAEKTGQVAEPAPAKPADLVLEAAPVPERAPDVVQKGVPDAADVPRLAETDGDARARKEAPAGGAAPEAESALADSTAAPDMYMVPAPSAVVAPMPAPDPMPQLEPNTEEFASAAANPVKITAEEPVSTFSTDIDTASYALVRSTLNMGVLPSPDQVRVEEMVNYFPYAYPAPEPGQAFRTTVSVMPTPWNAGTDLVTIGLQGELPALADRPALNLVFLIDTSGSMEDPNKLGLLKQSLALMLPDLRPEDQIAIVTYAGSAGLVLPPTKAADRDTILAALDNLTAGGSTAGAEGLELAYRTAKAMQGEGEVSRILLATDGDFNVGVSDPEGLTAYVAKKREQDGTYLSVLGFGRGNLDDATMQALAQKGNGQAAYIDTLSEARKVLVDQLTGALFSIADDVKVQVEWNPAQIAEYRLIGYETRALRREDFNNDKVDAGEIGAGLQVTAIYEVTPVGSDAVLNDPLRYGTATATQAEGELGFLRLRWKAPGEDESQLIEQPITGQEPATTEARFAAAIAGFGQLLQGSAYLGKWSWDDAIDLALSARGDDPYGYRTEAITLMRLAQSLSK
ncbi:von Willebrand factor type A domain-containing protein [Neotabrizicola sp. sgz301269]|uniref:YfbK domain-containing protein n=1 Tax=Neotabrizicola sp. sgz301269 TaxID=3276282 RepID=UPI003770297E